VAGVCGVAGRFWQREPCRTAELLNCGPVAVTARSVC
jgi:hypothetical protein